MTRTWRWPDLRNSAGTLHQITDTHFGAGSNLTPAPGTELAWLPGWLDRAQQDIETLRITTTAGHVHTGDMTDNWWHLPDSTVEEKIAEQYADYNTWRDAITAADGLPFAQCAGNHELLGGIYPDAGRRGTTGAQWAASVGLSDWNNAWDMGQFRVIGLSPDEWIPNTEGPTADFRLPQRTLDWLDQQLSADSRPTFLTAHVPLLAQYPDSSTGQNCADLANPGLHDLIGAHSNVVGWLSGHRHNSIADTSNPATVITVSGREIFAICSPGGGGGYLTGGEAYSKGQWQASMFSTYLTLLDEDTLDVRWRDHLRRRWVQDDPTQARIHLTRSN